MPKRVAVESAMRSCLVAAVLVTQVLGVAPGAAAQTLAEVARQEEARRRTPKVPAKVYTNDSLRSDGTPAQTAPVSAVTAVPLASPAAASPTAAAPAPAPAGAPGDAPRDEKYWRGRIDAARTAATRAQMFRDALQTRINALSADFVNTDDPVRRGVIGAERQRSLVELDRLKQEIADGQKAVTDIQEEARRANVPAGWTR